MRRLIAALRDLFGGSQTVGEVTLPYEFSAGFDQEMVKPFFSKLEQELGLGLKPAAIAAFSKRVPLEDSQSMAFEVAYEGTPLPIEFSVFKDDVDSPDIYIFSASAELIDRIVACWSSFSEELGI